MAAKFTTVIRKARFNAPGFSPQSMVTVGQAAIDSIQGRMLKGMDIYDSMAPPLSPKYGTWKAKKYGSGIRDMRATGRTFRSMKVLVAGQNTCTIGFIDPVVVQHRVRTNNRISRQWGLSDSDRRNIIAAVFDGVLQRPVAVVQEK